MKRKIHNLILVIMILTSFFSICVYGVFNLININISSSFPSLRRLHHPVVIDTKILNEIGTMKTGFQKINNYEPENILDQNLLNLFGLGPKEKNSKEKKKRKIILYI